MSSPARGRTVRRLSLGAVLVMLGATLLSPLPLAAGHVEVPARGNVERLMSASLAGSPPPWSAAAPSVPPLSVEMIEPFGGPEQCPAQHVEYTFFAFASGGLPPYSYRWGFGDGSPTSAGGPTVSHNYSASGNYTYNVTASDTAGASATAANFTHVVVIPCSILNPPPPSPSTGDLGSVTIWIGVGLLIAVLVAIAVALLQYRAEQRRKS